MAILSILAQLREERENQDKKWGEQNHPNGTSEQFTQDADIARAYCERQARRGLVTWKDILEEEIHEAYAEVRPEILRKELIQAAAVIVAWVESIDRDKYIEK